MFSAVLPLILKAHVDYQILQGSETLFLKIKYMLIWRGPGDSRPNNTQTLFTGKETKSYQL